MLAAATESVVRVPLTRGFEAIVDAADVHLVDPYSWSAAPYSGRSSRGWYAVSRVGRFGLFMHRLLMGAKVGERVDHVDGDGLNNRRENLRMATVSQNMQNSRKFTGTSKFKGVYWHKKRDIWIAKICLNQKSRFLGCFRNEAEAARAYNAAATELFGEFARLNEITEEIPSSRSVVPSG